MTDSQFPGVNGTSHYTEKLEVGYRWFDAHSVEPLYPFGHGLSYTTFEFEKPK
jgi:beta-glucosidase